MDTADRFFVLFVAIVFALILVGVVLSLLGF
jgi:predicted nucleic acid-binding Zn ribbon protein